MSYKQSQAERRRAGGLFVAVVAGLVGFAGLACDIESRGEGGAHSVTERLASASSSVASEAGEPAAPAWNWPTGEHPLARVEVRGFGTIDIELFPDLAPQTVQNFEKLAAAGFYDGTTFHRVIPGFMIQGGDPLTRNRDPRDDGQGGPGYTIRDEFTRAPHLRGAVSMANRSSPHSGGSQFFIVHEDSQHLDRRYSLFGRVVAGIEVVDRITQTERDTGGRWGPLDRPIEPVVIERLHVLRARPAASQAPSAGAPLARAALR
jgi:peptidyl-prolyl cis-trans isomerase B (cyclophilin B)